MRLAIAALGFQVWLQCSAYSWTGYKKLRLVAKFTRIYAESIREQLALETFIKALERRNRILASATRV